MKIKAGLLSAMLLAGLTLAACSDEGEDHGDMNNDSPSSDEIRSLEVDLQTPESIQSGEAAEFTAHVTSNEEDVTDATLTQAVHHVFENQESYIRAMLSNPASNAIEIIVELCEKISNK